MSPTEALEELKTEVADLCANGRAYDAAWDKAKETRPDAWAVIEAAEEARRERARAREDAANGEAPAAAAAGPNVALGLFLDQVKATAANTNLGYDECWQSAKRRFPDLWAAAEAESARRRGATPA